MTTFILITAALLLATVVLIVAAIQHNRNRSGLRLVTAAVEHAAETILIFDVNDRIVYVNPAFESTTGYAREEVIGKSASLIKSDQHSPAFYEALWKVVNTGQTWTGRIANRKKDGSVYRADVTLSPIAGPGGHTEYYVSTQRDVTRELQLEEQLEQANKMEAIGQLAGGIAHDFNNQLAAILGCADILRKELTAHRELQKYADTILRSATYSSDLIKQLLAFARKGKYLSVPLDLHDVVMGVISLLQHSVDKKIQITHELTAEPSTTLGDPAQIENALLNLGLNACDAMAEGGHLHFATATASLDAAYCGRRKNDIRPGRFIRITVTDDGCGMNEEIQTHIFEPFYTTKAKGKGTGMGLAAAYGTIKNHSGLINVYSEEGKGSSFEVYLPLVSTPEKAREPEEAPDDVVQSARILIVDDEESVRTVAADMLRSLGCRVTAFGQSTKAIDYFKENWRDIDLVLLDIVMPDMGGLESLRIMRQINPHIHAILSSGYSVTTDTEELLKDGMTSFLPKPFDIATLSHSVKTTLNRPRAN